MELLSEIDDLVNELHSYQPLATDQLEQLDKKFRLEFNYNSNHLEGNTLTYSETELLLFSDEITGNHTYREIEEMKASDLAYQKVKELASDPDFQLTEQFIKELNKILLVKPYWKEAITPNREITKRQISVGEYKKEPNSVLLENGEIFHYASPFETPALMGDLIEWLRNSETEMQLHAVEIAAELHYKFVRIHPFDDGNGRIARLLMNYILLKHSLPPVVTKSSDKKSYLRHLRTADTGDLSAFKRFIAKDLIWSIELSIKAGKNEKLEEDEDWKKHLSLIKRQLAHVDTIKTVKSKNAIQDVLSDTIYSAAIKTIENLDDFNELFFSKFLGLMIQPQNSLLPLNGSKLPLDVVSKYFMNNAILIIQFQEFTKDPDNTFTVDLKFKINFARHKYEIRHEENLLFKKLYHQIFTENDIFFFTNYIGKSVTNEIKQHTNTAI